MLFRSRISVRNDGDRPGAVQVTVEDRGEGMPEEVLARAFEPFYTTKGPGEGTGLGLSMAYGAITAQGGSISLDSRIGQGTCVTVLLECIDEPVSDGDAPVQSWGPLDVSVLLVDDDGMVRSVVLEQLESYGARVTEAVGGMEAVALLQSASACFELVLLDMTMPGMDGRETFGRIRTRAPSQPILVYSGYVGDESVASMLETGNCRFLRKPFRAEELHAAVSAMLPTGRLDQTGK